MALQGIPRPAELSSIRPILFNLPVPFSLTRADYEKFWPFIDNVYITYQSRNYPFQNPPYGVRYIRCRHKHDPRDRPPAPIRGPRKRAAISCDVRFKLLIFHKHVECWQLTDNSHLHTHSLDESDANRRNSVIKGLVRRELSRGHPPAEVVAALRGNGDPSARAHLDSAGGKYVSRQDATNSGVAWRLANPDGLGEGAGSRADASKQRISDALDAMRARFIEVAEYADSLGEPGRGNVLSRWNSELAERIRPLIGQSLEEWILADPARGTSS